MTNTEAADAFYNSRYGWVCEACGGRGLIWGFAGDGVPTEDRIRAAVTRAHGRRSPDCGGPVNVGLAVDLDPAMVAAVRAAGVEIGPVQATGASRLALEAALGGQPAVTTNGGPWATPDIFRTGR